MSTIARHRAVVVALTATCVLGVAAVVVGLRSDQPVTGSVVTGSRALSEGEVARRGQVVRAGDVLRRWDRRRAAAYAVSDAGALRRLYAPGSAAGLRDVRLLRSYAARGLAVEGLQMQLIDLQVQRRQGDQLVLRVQDRLAAGEVVSPMDRAALPNDRPSTRTAILVRVGQRWLMRSVRERY